VLPSQLPARPPVALDAKSFQRRRDPFLSFVASEVVVPEPERPRAERKVEMQQYAFEDLKLVAIVNAGRGMKPRALFVASDGKSHSIKQGDYFSSAEVLLAAVNRDYVEIEVVDDDLASSLNLQRGERRAIYLRNE
jgi:Tfp pilus assembly protein PilP